MILNYWSLSNRHNSHYLCNSLTQSSQWFWLFFYSPWTLSCRGLNVIGVNYFWKEKILLYSLLISDGIKWHWFLFKTKSNFINNKILFTYFILKNYNNKSHIYYTSRYMTNTHNNIIRYYRYTWLTYIIIINYYIILYIYLQKQQI